MSDTKERAVQRYLAFLEDPEVSDREQLAELENQLSVAANPIVKLRILAEIDLARTPNRVLLEDGFVRHAGEWAAENGIPLNAFLAMGVDQKLLAKAGFYSRPGSKKAAANSSKSKGAAASHNGEHKVRAKSVTSETVESLVLATKGPFSVRDIVAVSEATNATVSRVVGILVAAGRVENIGNLPPQGARGVAPQGYRVKSAVQPKPKVKAR